MFPSPYVAVSWLIMRSLRAFSLSLVALGSLLLCGCRDMRMAAEDSARLDSDLHSAMTRGDWRSIYANADPGYRENVTEQKSETLFQTIFRKLGAPISSKETAWNIDTKPSGTFLRVQCDTKFAMNASGVETITWHKSGEGYKLYGYYIDSDDLVTR